MPANLVKPGQEKYWKKAKELAEKQGRGNDYAYIVGIFKKMVINKSLNKGHFILPADRLQRIPGQVPSREKLELSKLVDTPPKPLTVEMLTSYTEPVLQPSQVATGLGLSRDTEKSLTSFIRDVSSESSSEVVFRQSLFRKLKDETAIEPNARKAIFQKAINYYRGLQKAIVEVWSVDDLIKASPKGGKYVRRVPTSKGAYRYYYDEDKYHNSKDAHVNGNVVASQNITKSVEEKLVANGKNGVSIKELNGLTKKYGSGIVANVLTDNVSNGKWQFKKGSFYAVKESGKSNDVNNKKSGKYVLKKD